MAADTVGPLSSTPDPVSGQYSLLVSVHLCYKCTASPFCTICRNSVGFIFLLLWGDILRYLKLPLLKRPIELQQCEFAFHWVLFYYINITAENNSHQQFDLLTASLREAAQTVHKEDRVDTLPPAEQCETGSGLWDHWTGFVPCSWFSAPGDRLLCSDKWKRYTPNKFNFLGKYSCCWSGYSDSFINY